MIETLVPTLNDEVKERVVTEEFTLTIPPLAVLARQYRSEPAANESPLSVTSQELICPCF